VGGVTLWSAFDTKQANDDYETYSVGPGALASESRTRYDRAKKRQDRTNVLLGATAVLGVGTAIIATFTDFGGAPSTAARRTNVANKRRADVWLSADGAQLTYSGSF
jgi:hypothetical protein